MYINTEKYKRRLKQKGLTANHLIDKTDVSRSQFYKYINAEIKVTPEFMLRLSNELVCPVNYLTSK
jgi:transcriptional regulator with XRE-family HTH domain